MNYQLLRPQKLLRRFRYQICAVSSKGGSSFDTAWERGAEKVKNTDLTNPYLEAIRKTHDPIQHIKTIEDELKSTIGRALGKQGQKILRAVHAMQEQLKLLEEKRHDPDEQLQSIVDRYNQYREEAMTARWELTVHRQAAGFIIGNHQYVTDAYPIPNKLPNVAVTEATVEAPKPEETKKKKNFTGQLEWWENVGRWK